MPPAIRKLAPAPAERRAIIRAIANRFGAKAPAIAFPQGLPPLKAIGPHTAIRRYGDGVVRMQRP